jgi:ABC-type transport system substrate-binding protein
VQPRSGLLAVALALLAGIVVLLAFQTFQLHNLEERLILQSRQLQALGDSSDRLSARVDALAQGGSVVSGMRAPADPYADVKLLFPERENLLAADDFWIAHPEAPQDQTLKRDWPSGEPATFNPLTGNAADVSSKIEHFVLEAPAKRARFTDPEKFVSELAWRVTANDDFTELIVYLRRGVKWHVPAGVDVSLDRYAWLREPRELTAHDMVFSFELGRHPQVESPVKSAYDNFVSAEALDDYTVRVRWRESQRLNFTVTIGSVILPEFLWAYDENGQRFPDETLGLRFNQHWYGSRGTVGTGPYRMVSYQPGERIVLERNEDYWSEKPAIRRLEYPIYSDPNRTLLMLKAHELHFGLLRSSEYQREVLQYEGVPEEQRPGSPFLNGDIVCHRVRNYAYSYIGWNLDAPLFSDRAVRLAMAQAFNRQEMIDEIYFGLGELAVGPFNPAGPYNDPSVEPVPYDLQAAAGTLAAAGWVDSDRDGLLDKDIDGDGVRDPLEFTLLIYANSPETTAYSNVLKEDLLSIGVQMKIEAAEWSLMQKRMHERQFDAYTGGWALPWESDPYYAWHSSEADKPMSTNITGFRDERVDELVLALRYEFDRERRIEMFREIHRRINEIMPYAFFRIPHQAYCHWKEVKGVQFAKARPQIDSSPWWIEPD